MSATVTKHLQFKFDFALIFDYCKKHLCLLIKSAKTYFLSSLSFEI